MPPKHLPARLSCPACGGTGQICFFQGVSRFLLTSEECQECAGLGYVLPLQPRVAVIGAGPAGLMAATVLAETNLRVEIFDAMPSSGRKFLVAGRGGLNLTHSEPLDSFVGRYGSASQLFQKLLTAFSPDHLRAWLHHTLGVETFIGTSGRIFPNQASAGEILKRWHAHLSRLGVLFHHHHRWQGMSAEGALLFSTPDGTTVTTEADAIVLALGGASWPQTGSDGGWVDILTSRGVQCRPFRPANCGFEVPWSPYFREHFSGTPLKNITVRCDNHTASGELMITRHGLEGGAIYQLSAAIRDRLEQQQRPIVVHVDLKRDLPLDRVLHTLRQNRGSQSMSSFLRKALRLSGPAYSLLREFLPAESKDNPDLLAQAIKQLPIPITTTRPLSEAISSAGGILLAEVNGDLMLTRLPGIFVAGEMLDWEAPTGGYLLQGAFSTGHRAALGIIRWLGPKEAASS